MEIILIILVAIVFLIVTIYFEGDPDKFGSNISDDDDDDFNLLNIKNHFFD